MKKLVSVVLSLCLVFVFLATASATTYLVGPYNNAGIMNISKYVVKKQSNVRGYTDYFIYFTPYYTPGIAIVSTPSASSCKSSGITFALSNFQGCQLIDAQPENGVTTYDYTKELGVGVDASISKSPSITFSGSSSTSLTTQLQSVEVSKIINSQDGNEVRWDLVFVENLASKVDSKTFEAFKPCIVVRVANKKNASFDIYGQYNTKYVGTAYPPATLLNYEFATVKISSSGNVTFKSTGKDMKTQY